MLPAKQRDHNHLLPMAVFAVKRFAGHQPEIARPLAYSAVCCCAAAPVASIELSKEEEELFDDDDLDDDELDEIERGLEGVTVS